MKSWWQSKTMQFALLKIVAGGLAAAQTQSWEPLILSGTAIIDMVLRSVTSETIGR